MCTVVKKNNIFPNIRKIMRLQVVSQAGRTDDSPHVARRHPLQIRLIRPMRTQVGRTSTIAETDDSAQWAESVFGRIIRLPTFSDEVEDDQVWGWWISFKLWYI